MIEGLLAAIALLFTPPAEARPPEALLVLDQMGCSLASPDYKPPPPIFLEIEADGAMTLNDVGTGETLPVTFRTLGATARGRANCAENGCERIFIRADGDTPYSQVLSVMSALRHNGIERIGLIDESW